MNKKRQLYTIYSILMMAFCISWASLPVRAFAEALPPEYKSAPSEPYSNLDGRVVARAANKSNTSILGPIANFTNHASELVMQAIGMLGIHYKYGGNTPENGLDCSGLVRYVYKETWGKDLPRTAAEISRIGQRISLDDLQPGDLVFYNTLKRGFSHVGIYLGENKFIHSPSAGGEVRIESMDISYWKKRFNGARRIDAPNNVKD